jgi:hypothetical protein
MAVGLPAEPGRAPRLRLVRPDGRGLRGVVGTSAIRALGMPRESAHGRGLARKAGPRTTATTGAPSRARAPRGRASIRDSGVGLPRESAHGRGLARKAGPRTTATTGAPSRAGAPRGRGDIRDSGVGLPRESAHGRGLARRAGPRTTATTGAPSRAGASHHASGVNHAFASSSTDSRTDACGHESVPVASSVPSVVQGIAPRMVRTLATSAGDTSST